MHSSAYFISQPSIHGNLLLPVIPRFDPSGQLKWLTVNLCLFDHCIAAISQHWTPIIMPEDTRYLNWKYHGCCEQLLRNWICLFHQNYAFLVGEAYTQKNTQLVDSCINLQDYSQFSSNWWTCNQCNALACLVPSLPPATWHGVCLRACEHLVIIKYFCDHCRQYWVCSAGKRMRWTHCYLSSTNSVSCGHSPACSNVWLASIVLSY